MPRPRRETLLQLGPQHAEQVDKADHKILDLLFVGDFREIDSHPLHPPYGFSHDCFIFRSPLDKLDLNKLKVKQNVWGSESLVLQELKKKEYITRNPCKHIIIIHEHQSDIREKNRGNIVGAGESDYYSCKPLPLNTRINEIYQKKPWNL